VADNQTSEAFAKAIRFLQAIEVLCEEGCFIAARLALHERAATGKPTIIIAEDQ
jgi:hypothetical protein